MAEFITPFDPSASAGSTFIANMPNGGWIFIHNESPVEVSLQVGGMATPVLVPAYVARCFPVRQAVTRVKWANVGNVNGGGQAPISLIFGELYDPDEWTGGEVYQSLTRLTNVGNTVATSGANKLINDGNAPGTQFIEATPSDQATSSVSLNNDASGYEKVLSAGVLRAVRNVTRGDSGATKATIVFGDAGDASITTLHGNADTATNATNATNASSVPATGVTAGALGGSVTLAGSSITGDVAANQIGPGALDSDVTMGAAAITGGNLVSGVKQQNGSTVAGLNSAGGGSAGTQIWVGTSDPGGSAAEGDIWIKA